MTSRVINRSLNPLFDDHLVLFLVDYQGSIQVSCYDYDKLKRDDIIGTADILLNDLPHNRTVSFWLQLADTKNARIRLNVTRYEISTMDHRALQH